MKKRFPFATGEIELFPRYNIAPGQLAPVIVNDDAKSLKMMRWGLVPYWSKDETTGYKMINARAESVADKPAFRNPLERRRCLVLADGFYEWKKAGSLKMPYRFVMRDNEPFAFAGLWERWRKPDDTMLETFTIITTDANDLCRPIHDRMPVILPPEACEHWLDRSITQPDRLIPFLSPCPAKEMDAYAVSPVVNNPNYETPQCIERVPAQAELSL